MHQLRADRNVHHNLVQRQGTDSIHELQLSGPSRRHSQHAGALFQRCYDHDAGSDSLAAGKSHRNGSIGHSSQSRVGCIDGNGRNGQQLPGAALRGRGMHQLRAGWHVCHYHVQRHGTGDGQQLQLPRAGQRHGRGLSPFSNVASATPGPPTAPSGLTATAASMVQINLSWTASTSSVGLANYIVQRCQGRAARTSRKWRHSRRPPRHTTTRV